MPVIHRPLTGHKDWRELSFYRAYADLALHNIDENRRFEAIVVCCVGLDVLLNTIVDRLLRVSSHRLDNSQTKLLQAIQNKRLTGGAILNQFQRAGVLDKRLLAALIRLNGE
jgi:hypothetical protein